MQALPTQKMRDLYELDYLAWYETTLICREKHKDFFKILIMIGILGLKKGEN